MAAGLGFKTFNTGDVLSASDVNGYLMQGVLVFASTAARDAAITAPAEGQFAFTKDTNSLFYYDGAAWVASGATGDIEGVTAGTGISGGGTSGTVTVTNSMATAIDAKGDLIVGTGADAFSRLAVGTNTHVLTADSAEATGLKWAAPAGGGSGMTLVQRSSFSNVAGTSTTFDGVFTSTYVSYLIAIETCYSSTQTDDLQFLFRYAGPTDGDGMYGNFLQMAYNASTFVASQINNVAFATINSSQSSGYPFNGNLNIMNIGTTTQPSLYSMGMEQDNTKLSMVYAYTVNARTYTGFRLRSASSNITGTVAVYGLAKS
jgi:hypothetical protein